MRCDLGVTHLEMGRRLKDREHLKLTETIFAEYLGRGARCSVD
jgi:hypothetical protein